jgi:hypothetical protein
VICCAAAAILWQLGLVEQVTCMPAHILSHSYTTPNCQSQKCDVYTLCRHRFLHHVLNALSMQPEP